jgi:hypothetical protein
MGKAGLGIGAAFGVGFVLASCSTPSYPTTAAPTAAPAQAPAPVAATAPPRSPIPRPQVSDRDQCGASALQGLVGRPKSEIPVPVNPARQRVACTTCAVTMDYSAERLNFFFDAQTGRIKEIRCG